jgi:protein-disulfide isomerase
MTREHTRWGRPKTRTAAALAACALLTVAGCTAQVAPDVPPQAAVERTPTGDFRTLGAADAPVIVIEFTDLQCPYCARFALEAWPKLRERYVVAGKVQFVSRDLPLSIHAHAIPAAVAARCAGDQGFFWEYREAVFRDQSRLAGAPYAELAGRLGLDVERFEACRANPALTAAVREDAALAAANGIAATPTCVIGRLVDGEFQGEILSGAQPFEAYAQKIDALLAEAAR